MIEKNMKIMSKVIEVPVLPLRDVVIYPGIVMPLFVGRKQSIDSVDIAMNSDKQVLLVAQKDGKVEKPEADDLFSVGTIANILQVLKLPDGTIKILVEGERRANVKQYRFSKEMIFASISFFVEMKNQGEREDEAYARSILQLFEEYVKSNRKIPPEILTAVSNLHDLVLLIDTIAAHIPLKMDQKQKLLEIPDLINRSDLMLDYLKEEIDLLKMEKEIGSRVKGQMEKTQKEYYLNEQLKAIKKELGEMDSATDEFSELEKQINKSGMTKEAKGKAFVELKKLRMMPPMSAEATVSRNYLDILLKTPWKKKNKLNRDLLKAQKILDKEHYGLDKIKERILEYLAVQSRVEKLKGPILCLVGPPGVGKTSLGRSIAHATGRKFTRMALGGMRDEAEIRGHRRTYVGALPGKIIHNLIKVNSKNPLFLLDEIDKMAMDFRGDPASALLEVLDPEQNHTFNDHYLEVDYDLSDVMFVTTANTLDIPPALADRMEIIHLSGYTEDEKINIALQYLIPKQLEQNGLKPSEIDLSKDMVREIIRYYTREAGVRNLEREISKLFRKVVKSILLNKKLKHLTVNSESLEELLGVRKYRYGEAEKENQIGQITGLAWTEVGGDLLTIEVAQMPGKGKAIITGQLGEVMQESIQAAMSVIRSRADRFGLKSKIFEDCDLHIHVPEGAIPKDGPSAGAAMCVALLSVLTKTPVRADMAMTGEITLRGEILPIGGLKEKLLAAKRGNIKHVLIPQENIKDLKEIPSNVIEGLEIHPVRWIEEALKLLLTKMPTAKKTKRRTKFSEGVISQKKQPIVKEKVSSTH